MCPSSQHPCGHVGESQPMAGSHVAMLPRAGLCMLFVGSGADILNFSPHDHMSIEQVSSY